MNGDEKQNKSLEVRNYMKAHPKAKPTAVSAAMKEIGLDVSPAAVSNIKFQTKAKKRRGRKAKEAVEAVQATNGAAGATKAQQIRDTFQTMGLDAAPKDVVATLAVRGVDVSTPHVISIRNKLVEKQAEKKTGGVKRKLKRRRKARASAPSSAPAAASGDTITLDSLIATKALAQKLGGIGNLRSALSALEKLS